MVTLLLKLLGLGVLWVVTLFVVTTIFFQII